MWDFGFKKYKVIYFYLKCSLCSHFNYDSTWAKCPLTSEPVCSFGPGETGSVQVVFSCNPVCHLDFSFEVVFKDALWKKQRRPCGARLQQTRRRRGEQVSFQPEAATEHYYTEWTQHQYAVFKSDKNTTSFSCLTIRFPRTQSDTANTAEDEGIWFQALTQQSWIKRSSVEQSVKELVELSQWRAHAIQKRREQGGTATVFMSGNTSEVVSCVVPLMYPLWTRWHVLHVFTDDLVLFTCVQTPVTVS